MKIASFLIFLLTFSISTQAEVLLNDMHSELNETSVREVIQPASIGELRNAVRDAVEQGKTLSISGGRHAMGGQQFGKNTLHIDTRKMTRILHFDRKNGTIEVEAGIQWPELIAFLIREQQDSEKPWGIRQKQTGGDNMTIGGTLSANAHGRGLNFAPIVQDIESIQLVNTAGDLITCSREENRKLFRLAIGGYGLFGVIASAKIRLVPRQKLQRHVRMAKTGQLMELMSKHVSGGYLYGDFQYLNDPKDDQFLRLGVFSAYHPVPNDTPIPKAQKKLTRKQWRTLHLLSHTDPDQAFSMYSGHYLSTHGQIYWTDTHQLGTYIDHYHKEVDQKLGAPVKGSEMITELYVPRASLLKFMEEARTHFLTHDVSPIYGTIRLIRRDDETFLAWAREDFVCIIFNLHVEHSPEGIDRAARHFRALIDIALENEGSYFLTYHRFATKFQVTTAYPQFLDFLKLKLEIDPQESFQSEWYRHYRAMFAEDLFR